MDLDVKVWDSRELYVYLRFVYGAIERGRRLLDIDGREMIFDILIEASD